MRSFTHLAAILALTAAASTVAIATAEAQSRKGPLRVTVQKRSYFDAGNVVAVGSLSRYVTQHVVASPVYASTGEFYGEGTLPGRFTSGPNPFVGTFATPRF